MSYTTRQINRDFRVKVYGMFDGKKVNSLRGVSGILEMIGEEMLDKFIRRAYNNTNGDFTRCALRRGLVITLYNK